jgi:NAD+ kinase
VSADSVTSPSNAFRRVAVIAKPDDAGHLIDVLQSVRGLLASRNLELLPDLQTARLLGLGNGEPVSELARRADLGIVVGGDGTLLSAARELADHEIPILGVNLGRLGFLVDITPADIHACLAAVFDGHYDAESRFLLSAQVGTGPTYLALNDVVLHKWNIARMIEFETWIDGRFVYTQRSDGLIISTPTGSTAYALSGGGPLMTPDLAAVALVPICPHTLSNRPIVIGADSTIEISVCGNTDPADVRITCDGANNLTLQEGERLTVNRHSTEVRLLHPVGHDHFDVLRAKLGWGELPKH